MYVVIRASLPNGWLGYWDGSRRVWGRCEAATRFDHTPQVDELPRPAPAAVVELVAAGPPEPDGERRGQEAPPPLLEKPGKDFFGSGPVGRTEQATATPAPVRSPAMRPAYLGDAALDARIRFDLPASGGGLDSFAGRVTAYDRDRHAVGFPTIRLQLDTTGDRVFTCRPNLHIDIEDN